MKRNLAKAVALGLICASVLPGGSAGAVDILSGNTVKINNNNAHNYSIIKNQGVLLFKTSGLTYNGNIDNYGDIKIDCRNIAEPMRFSGYIEQSDGNIDITLKGVKNKDSYFNGYIHYGAIGDPQLNFVIDEGGVWIVTEGGASDAVKGVSLNNGGTISLAGNFDKYWNPYKNWDDEFHYLHLVDFKSNGKWDKGGGFIVYTDLKNDIGDNIGFIGKTPDVEIPFLIINKDDNNGIPIKKEDNHSVTIATYNGGWDGNQYHPTNMKIKADYMYGGNNKVYKPIVEEITGQYNEYSNNPYYKEWNFVGWSELDRTRNGNDIKDITIIDPHILVEDLDENLKRLNDIRTDPSEVGVWIRGEKGDTQIRNYKYEYNLMSGGYDWHNENDARKLFYGFGVSYATNECDDSVVGDTKSMGYNLYGSWLGKKNNDYVDVILKYGTLDKDYAGIDNNGVLVKGSYDKDLFAIAAKYGRRIFVDDSFYYEPQIGYTYGRVGSADYVDNWDTHIHADASNSHIASLGVQVGKNIKGTEVYGKLAYVYDFDGNIHVSAPGISADDDMGGGYMQVAIGASRKVDKDNSFYIDVEKDFGNKVKKPYAFSVGYRHTF